MTRPTPPSGARSSGRHRPSDGHNTYAGHNRSVVSGSGPGRLRRLALVLGALALVLSIILLPEAQSSATSDPSVTVTPAPTVTSISAPSSGPNVGGAMVTINGTGFVGYDASDTRFVASQVTFETNPPQPALSFQVNSATSITAAAPAGQGTVDVTVTTEEGTSPTSPADQYTYLDNWSQGIVSSLPSTQSAVSNVTGTGPLFAPGQPYANFKLSVNQTQNLTDQAISLSWTGGVTTQSNQPGSFNGNYVQIFECWGNPQSSDPPDPSDPGPLPSQCEFGGESSSSASYPVSAPGYEYSREVTEPDWSTYSPSTPECKTDPATDAAPCLDGNGLVVQPFQAVDGTVVKQQANYAFDENPNAPLDYWLNPYFSFGTTNEVDFARTLSDETGQTLFDVDTGLGAPGLGCGQSVQPTAGGGTTTPQCWLVVVPRSDASTENPPGIDPSSLTTSPLTPEAWANRIAIPLKFNPVGSSCSINAESQEIEGSELASPAVSSWEPALCDLPGAQPYSYLTNDDDQARENLTNPSYGSVGMSVFSDPIPAGATGSDNPVDYAPLTLSGAVIAFNIQRVPNVEPDGTVDQYEEGNANSRVQNLYLTPRLVAKVLTESYQAELKGVARTTNAAYQWVQKNPISIFNDPDFLQYNPEFELMTTAQQIDAASMVVEEGSSDAATTLWKWVLADPSARAWLSGQPDPWGMVVNPYYKNLIAQSTAPENYPKSDPWCDSHVPDVDYPPNTPARSICIQDWSPYVLSMTAAAQAAATANDGGKTTFNPANTPDTAWTANGPQITGNDLVISVTDSASAARYGLQTASLSPAGEDTDPTFVDPDSASILAGEQAMVKSSVPDVLETDPSSTAADAYPLTMLTYAAATPEKLSQSARNNYAAFLQYAAGPGQVQGVDPGNLPGGYVPLPSSLVTQTLAAADAIEHPPVYPSASTKPTTTAAKQASTSTNGSSTEAAGLSSTAPAPQILAAERLAKAAGRERPRTIGPAALSAVRVIGLPVGALRWILPLLLLFGLLAALGAVVLKVAGRPAAEADAPGPGSDEAETEI